MRDIQRKFLLAMGVCLIMVAAGISEIRAEEDPSAADQDSPKRIKLETEKEPHLVTIEKRPAPKEKLKFKKIPPPPVQAGKEIEIKEVAPTVKPVEGERTRGNRAEQGGRFNFGAWWKKVKKAVSIAPSSKKVEVGEAHPLGLVGVEETIPRYEIDVKVGEAKPITPGKAVGQVTADIITTTREGTTTRERTTPRERTATRERTARPLKKSDKEEE